MQKLEKLENLIHKIGLSKYNNIKEKIIQFCKEKYLLLSKIWILQYTRASVGGYYLNQIDCKIGNRRRGITGKSFKAFPNKDFEIDNELLCQICGLKLKSN